jgi:uncharacterized protein YneF (UPF0154 family)
MNRKRSVSIILIVLSIILIGIAGYFTLIKKLKSNFTTKETFITSTPIKETLSTTSPTLEKLKSYDLEFDRDSIVYLYSSSSKDNKYVYFIFKNIKYNKYYIQINNQTYGPYDDNPYVQFSNDGSKYGWDFKKDSKHYIQINNQTYGPYDYIPRTGIYGSVPKFSNDGSKYGWLFGKDCKNGNECKQYYIQINNQTYGPYDKTDFTFTKDNKVYIIYIKDNKMITERID